MMGGMPASRSLFSGKILLILVAVFASAGGFALGYFVGQNAPVSPSLVPSGSQVNDAPVATGPQSANADVKAEAPAQEDRAVQDTSPGNGKATVTPVSHEGPTGDFVPAKKDSKTDILKTRAVREPEKSELQEPAVSAKKKAPYTVQAASFKRQKDAEALKKSLETKGYDKVSVRKETTAKGPIFKVRVGEFEQRKDASVEAIRLNKAEGLTAFVTLKKQ